MSHVWQPDGAYLRKLAHMIEQSDRQLIEWVSHVLGPTSVSLTPPGTAYEGSVVSLYLLNLGPLPPLRTVQQPTLQIALRYLVTTWASTPEEAHTMLGNLVFAALDNPDFEVDLDFSLDALWTAFGIPPRPAFILKLPLRFVKTVPKTPLVRQPIVIQATPISLVQGQILGPNAIPIPDARVELPTLHLSTTTDTNGRFTFTNVPRSSAPRVLNIRAKGREQRATITFPPDGAPVVIRFDFVEE